MAKVVKLSKARPPRWDSTALPIVGSWGDTLGDEEILALLREYNATGRVLHQPQ
jgi:hypothetical protein